MAYVVMASVEALVLGLVVVASMYIKLCTGGKLSAVLLVAALLSVL